MLAELKPYPEYKDMPDLFGAVPAHWEPRRLRNVSRTPIRNGVGESAQAFNPDWPRYVRITDIADPRNLKKRGAASLPPEIAADAPLNKGDVVLAAVGATYGKSYLHTSDAVPACYAGYLVRVSPTPEVVPEFLSYWTESSHYWNQVQAQVIKATIENFSASRYKGIRLALPPPAEQAGIVRFLGAVDRKGNRFIRAKRRLIEVLTEQKQAIITHAVTKGLNPHAPLKPSGIDWLGDVPEHWTVARAGSVAEFISTKAHEQFVEDDGEHICVTARFVSTDGRSFRRCTQNFSPAQRGDVLMVMSDLPRGRALARAYFVDDDRSYAVNQRVCILRPKRVNPRYLAFAANRHAELLAHDDGFNQTHLPNATFKIMRLPLPPLNEQEQIVESLVRTTSAIDATLERTEREIDLIREYRTRLVADVVTGKVDVRAAAAALPDEPAADEPTPDDDAQGADAEGGADAGGDEPEHAPGEEVEA